MKELLEFNLDHTNAPVVDLKDQLLSKAGIRLLVKREDLLHPEISGNKWRKLKYNLLEARNLNFSTLLTFGGPYSNHIYATAAAGYTFGFKTIGIIRGEQPPEPNPTLQFAQQKGMQLLFVNRTEYRDKTALLSKLPLDLKSVYVVPEGGTNSLALKGCAEIVEEYEERETIDYWCVTCGTGGTMAGIITTLKNSQKAIGISALKGDFHKKEIERLLMEYCDKKFPNWSINTDYHFGGYAKFGENLIRFINEFKSKFQIQLDPIYTGKMFYGIFDLIRKGYFPKGSKIMAIHTGGQQGNKGFNQRFGNLLK